MPLGYCWRKKSRPDWDIRKDPSKMGDSPCDWCAISSINSSTCVWQDQVVVCVCHQVDLVQRVRMHTKRVRLAAWLKNGKNEKYRWQNGKSHWEFLKPWKKCIHFTYNCEEIEDERRQACHGLWLQETYLKGSRDGVFGSIGSVWDVCYVVFVLPCPCSYGSVVCRYVIWPPYSFSEVGAPVRPGPWFKHPLCCHPDWSHTSQQVSQTT